MGHILMQSPSFACGRGAFLTCFGSWAYRGGGLEVLTIISETRHDIRANGWFHWEVSRHYTLNVGGATAVGTCRGRLGLAGEETNKPQAAKTKAEARKTRQAGSRAANIGDNGVEDGGLQHILQQGICKEARVLLATDRSLLFQFPSSKKIRQGLFKLTRGQDRGKSPVH